MAYTVRLAPKAEKDLRKIPTRDRDRIFLALQSLEHDPFLGKKLKGEYEGLFSLRVWPYRIIYQPFHRQLLVIVIRIGHRQGVY